MPEIARTYQTASYASDVVSVKDFGAVGDGVTDDSAAIQAALDAGPHVSIDLLGGIYVIQNATISLDGVTLRNGRLLVGPATVGAALTVTGDGVRIENVKLTVDSGTFTDDVGLVTFNGCTGGFVTNCYLSGSRRSGGGQNRSHMVCAYNSSKIIIAGNEFDDAHFTEMVYIDSSFECVVNGNTLHSAGSAYSAITTEDSLAVGGYANHVITGNVCKNFQTSIITINGTKGVTLSGNTCDTSSQEQGINLGHTGNGADECTITANTIINCAGAGVTLSDSSNCVVSGNLITGSGENGIDVSGTSNECSIVGNNIKTVGNGSTGNGIKLSATSAMAVNIASNTLSDLQGHGIEVNGTIVNLAVSNNTFRNINTGAFGGGRFPIGGTLSAGTACESIIFDGNTVLGPTTTNRIISVSNSDASCVVRITNNCIPAISTSAEYYVAVSGGFPASIGVEGNVISSAAGLTATATIPGGASSVVVSNANQTPLVAPAIFAGDADSAGAELYISSYGTGTFTISANSTPSSNAVVWYRIP